MQYSEGVLSTFEPLFATYWNKKWKKANVQYKIRNGETWLMTDFLIQSYLDCSFTFDKSLIHITDTDTTELKMYKIETWVKDNLKYVSDKKSWNQIEYWQFPKESFEKGTGDCEDGAILIYSLAKLYDVPNYRIKLCAGYVMNPNTKKLCGHAYIIFLRNDMTWCVCDWCYYPTVSRIQNRPQHQEMINYKEIWWTSNSENSWAQKDVKLNFEGL